MMDILLDLLPLEEAQLAGKRRRSSAGLTSLAQQSAARLAAEAAEARAAGTMWTLPGELAQLGESEPTAAVWMCRRP